MDKSSINPSSSAASNTPSTQSLLLFNPNEIVDDNTMVAQMVKQNITLLQKCLKSSNKAIRGAPFWAKKNGIDFGIKFGIEFVTLN